jgi:hypothetical protein
MYRELDPIGKLFGAKSGRFPKRRMSNGRRRKAGNAGNGWDSKATSTFRTIPNKANVLETLGSTWYFSIQTDERIGGTGQWNFRDRQIGNADRLLPAAAASSRFSSVAGERHSAAKHTLWRRS